ncbi:DUF1488 domain-containing protein [Paraburkholderia sp. CNPSo 3281]|uniref:DUF1488 domain-containing protein n=1 Tax=Paraburkholderia sp. CNPSo 3281 TaxID=2940933 RepID=UPI0020B78A4B|nr:DUF1488 domain-containing protein [Paraburkholderia sp. CNPSo 3281]MCP3720472.1 DUF1488 domain-containing protein [Paraburkholderia sp. CNPSo 3281]
MNISFPEGPVGYDTEEFALTFVAVADSVAVDCAITAEALEDRFGARSLREPDLRQAFHRNRAAIESAAARLIEETDGKPVMLHSGYLRMYGTGRH